MPSPVVPSQFEAGLVSTENTKCEGFVKSLIQNWTLFWQWLSWFHDDSGNISQEVKRGILPAGVEVNSFALLDEEDNHMLLCDGREVARVGTFAALFAAIGTTYGVGNGSTTFNIPDSRNRFAVTVGSDYAAGANGGADTFTIAKANLPAANITITGGNFVEGLEPDQATNKILIDDDWQGSEAINMPLGGSGTAIDNRPRYGPARYTFITY